MGLWHALFEPNYLADAFTSPPGAMNVSPSSGMRGTGTMFWERLRRQAQGSRREQNSLRDEAAEEASWGEIVSALERVKGERWEAFAQRHGDWGRDAALWLGRRVGRVRLAALGESARGLDYAVVIKAVTCSGSVCEGGKSELAPPHAWRLER